MRRALVSVLAAVVVTLSVAAPVGASSSPGALVGFRPVALDLHGGMEVPTVELDLVDAVSSLYVTVLYLDDQDRPAFHLEVPELGSWPGGTGTFAFPAAELVWFADIYGAATVDIEQVCLYDFLAPWDAPGACYSGDEIRAFGDDPPSDEPRDTTPPTVWFEGYQEHYGLTEQVVITCAAEDEASGIASLQCDGVTGPALELFGQTVTATATATDGAGNATTVSRAFTIHVVVDVDGLIQLTRERVTKPGVANALVAKLRNGAFGAYINHVRSQAGKSMTVADAELLTRLARQVGSSPDDQP